VEKIKGLLSNPAVEVFVAQDSVAPGQSLSSKITDAIKSCDLFILLWTSNSHESEWVRHELGIASGNGKTVLPVLLGKNITPPSFLNDIKYLSGGEDPTPAFDRLRKDVFERASKSSQSSGLIWLLLGGLVIWLLYQSDRD
jgi:hypothetical protein